MNTLATPVTVIMPSYLGNYPDCAMNREEKFHRAVKSFLAQDYQNKRLLIVSDGCEITSEIYKKEFASYIDISLIEIEKQELFSGTVRQAALDKCFDGIVCYLDTDDFFKTKTHLSVISSKLNNLKADWVYFDESIGDGIKWTGAKKVSVEHGSIGASSIAHKLLNGVTWTGCDGYGHDWLFIQKLIAASSNYKKISGTGYAICHIPNKMEC